jgi:hypothetical protein
MPYRATLPVRSKRGAVHRWDKYTYYSLHVGHARMPGFSGLASADFEGFLHTATSGVAPGFFYARSELVETGVTRRGTKWRTRHQTDLFDCDKLLEVRFAVRAA